MANLSNINNKFLVTTGGNVLIGQTSAVGSSKLQVTGTITADTVDGTVITDGFITMGFAQLNRYGAAIELQYTPTNAATLVKIGANGSNPTIFNAYTGDATFAGNVGIGLTPNASYSKLQLKAPASSYGFDLIGRDAGSNGESQITFWNSNQTTQLAAIFNTTDNLGFVTGTTERMRIENTGVMKFANTATSTGDVGTIAHYTNDYMYIRGGTGGLAIGDDGFDTSIYLNNSDSMSFNTAGVQKMRINSQGQTWIGGGSYTGSDIANGSTSYLNSLNAGAFSILHRNSSDAYIHFNSYFTSSSTYVSKYTGIGMMIGVNAAVDNGMFFSKAPSVNGGQVQTYETGIMQIGYGANNHVGIGTTSPAAKLDIGIGTLANNGYGGLRIFDDANHFWMLIQKNSVGASRLSLYNGQGSIPLVFQEGGGNVGIGTTSPDTRLHIYGSSTVSEIYLGEDAAVDKAGILKYNQGNGTGTGTVQLGNYGDNLSIDGITIKKGGNVGIGTTTVINEKLSVYAGASTGITTIADVLGVYANVNLPQANRGAAIRLGVGPDGAYSTKIATVYEQSSPSYLNPAMVFYTMNNSYIKGTEVERMRITSAGTIFMYGLGGYTSNNADVRYATSSKELYYQTSSKRYKTNIVNLENSLDKINKLRPVRYVDINTEEPACGLIAEETVEIIPEVVFTKEIEGFDKPQVEGINYSDLVPFLIKSIQELKAEIELLKSK